MTLPTPCPADLIPEATGLGAYTAVYQQAKRQRAVLVAVERQAQLWTVTVDTLTAGPAYAVADTVIEALRAAVAHLVRSREIRPDSHASPVYMELYDIGTESRARELAAALHAALYGDLTLLSRAVPEVS
ncbi:hypothetical protein OG331_51730 [Streptomyces sp. NBC_01017]|uniref:hypothetical protein n=1 Tax=Streptomyces sp. NBC_01017 TaxID=2903721 RepID=UPI00386BE3DE|nr:hypothetical protein OG331_00240 [Streptomyces sp. NBC_01017]WSV35365.1 hypothetical protein OG331_51730 [Streptomyces sp. NBC_01017]